MNCPALGPEFRGERVVNPVPRRLADTRSARALLGFSATVDLDGGLRDLVEWWRNERVGIGADAYAKSEPVGAGT